MKGLKIKMEFAETQIGFNNSGLPLGLRNDIHILAKTAIESNDQSLLNLFEELPTAEAIKEYGGELFLANMPTTETPVVIADKPKTDVIDNAADKDDKAKK
jgi:hypothetical protein